MLIVLAAPLQAHIDLNKTTMRLRPEEPVWLPLSGEKGGGRIEGLGHVRVAVWLSEGGDMGRLSESKSAPHHDFTVTMMTTIMCMVLQLNALPLPPLAQHLRTY